MLREIGTDYIDVGMIHYSDSMEVGTNHQRTDHRICPTVERGGEILHIGLSSHNPEVATAAVKSGLIEVVLFSINPCYDMQTGHRKRGRSLG